MAEKEPAIASTPCCFRSTADDVRHGEADGRAERDQGRLRAEDGAEGQRPESSQRDARRVGDRRRLGADAV